MRDVETGLDRRTEALLVLVVCGAGSVLLDLDHVVALALAGIPISWENLATKASRFLHVPVTLAVCAVSGLVGAFVAGRNIVERG